MQVDQRFINAYDTKLNGFFGGTNSSRGAQKGPILTVLKSLLDTDVVTAAAKFIIIMDKTKNNPLDSYVVYNAKYIFIDTANELGAALPRPKFKM